MRQKLGYIGLIMFCIAAVGAAFSYTLGGLRGRAENPQELRLAASFYPVYIIALNLTEGIPGVQVQNLTANQSGCLHDYQLTTRDMRLLEQADALLANGGGMEPFLEQAAKTLPDLPIIYSDQGVELLTGEAHSHDHEHNQEHSQKNAHIWLSPKCYQAQIRNLTDGLIALDPKHQAAYEENRDRYLAQVEEVAKEYQDVFSGEEREPVLLFHEAFAYLAEIVPLEVIETLELEGEEQALRAGKMRELIEEIRLHQIRYLLTEDLGVTAAQEGTVAEVLAKEGGAKLIALNPLTKGESDTSSWLDGMRENLETLILVLTK
ncbi:MAG: zinc ABC transporter solute-binding protein [Lachnospiraceae bacterium]|jgi:zinc transport system substrate-binding protein|nr:zinc ABC transporter solute-binding protein [Lachnospiraceae bacterium]